MDETKYSTTYNPKEILGKAYDFSADKTTIGKYYEISSKAYEGGMGEVYFCRDKRDNKFYALKCNPKEDFHFDKWFQTEATFSLSIPKHPYIVYTRNIISDDKNYYIVMDFIGKQPYSLEDKVEGETLRKVMNKTCLEPTQALIWAIQFCEGMAFLNKEGMTAHKDIKPDNIFIAPDNTIRIADFGLSFTDKVGGTEGYLPPEYEKEQFNVKSDIYSFGIVLYQMLNNAKHPFDNTKYGGKLKRNDYVSAENIKTAHCEEILKKCLCVTPDGRYGNFLELREDLVKYLRKIAPVYKIKKAKPEPMTSAEYFEKGIACYGLLATGVGYSIEKTCTCRLLKKAIKLDPKNADALFWLGVLYRIGSDIEKEIAKKLFKRALELKPDYVKDAIKYTWCETDLFYEGQPYSFLQDGKILPLSIDIVAYKYYINGKFKKALECYKKINEKFNIVPASLSNLCNIKLKEKFKDTIDSKTVEKFLKENPSFYYQFDEIGNYKYHKNLPNKFYFDKKNRIIREIKTNNEDISTYNPNKGKSQDVFFWSPSEIRTLILLGRYKKALKILESIRPEVRGETYYSYLGFINYYFGDYQKALQCFKNARFHSSKTYRNKCIALYILKTEKRLLAKVDARLKINNIIDLDIPLVNTKGYNPSIEEYKAPFYILTRAVCHFRLGEYQKYLDIISWDVNRHNNIYQIYANTDLCVLQNALSARNIGFALMKIGKYKEALKCFKELLPDEYSQIYGVDTALAENLINCYKKLKNGKKVKEVQKLLLKSKRSVTWNAPTIERLLYAEDYKETIRILDKLDPCVMGKLFYSYKGMAFYMLKEYKKAVEMFNLADKFEFTAEDVALKRAGFAGVVKFSVDLFRPNIYYIGFHKARAKFLLGMFKEFLEDINLLAKDIYEKDNYMELFKIGQLSGFESSVIDADIQVGNYNEAIQLLIIKKDRILKRELFSLNNLKELVAISQKLIKCYSALNKEDKAEEMRKYLANTKKNIRKRLRI